MWIWDAERLRRTHVPVPQEEDINPRVMVTDDVTFLKSVLARLSL